MIFIEMGNYGSGINDKANGVFGIDVPIFRGIIDLAKDG